MEINCWVRQGQKQTLKAPNPKPAELAALRAALREVRAGAADDRGVVYELASGVPTGVRNAARVVMGIGIVVVSTLSLALVVVDAPTRSTLVPVIVTVGVLAGLFVMVVWQLDVTVTLHADGRLRRRGWGGITEVDVRDFRRVTVKLSRTADDHSMLGGFD